MVDRRETPPTDEKEKQEMSEMTTLIYSRYLEQFNLIAQLIVVILINFSMKLMPTVVDKA